MIHQEFRNAEESHAHSLEVLNLLYEYDDFMESVGKVIDLGCGQSATDLQWWATRTTRDDAPLPLNIKCTGVDLVERLDETARSKGISYWRQDIEKITESELKFDVLWCHDTFQYLLNPMQTLANLWTIGSPNAMLILSVPQTTNVQYNKQLFDQPSYCYYNHTMISLIHMLAVNGWDCKDGFFKKNANDPWLYAAVYRSEYQPMDPKTTSWYTLAEKKLLPDSAEKSLMKYGYPRQQDLVLPWLDKSLHWMAQQ
jgi:SAM-dependent methyltransferase